jgi:hypothetical protein
LQIGFQARLVVDELLLGVGLRAVLEDVGELAAQFGFAAAETLDLLILEVPTALLRRAACDGAGAVDDGALERDG